MIKKLVAGTAASIAVSLGLWLGLGSHATAQPAKSTARAGTAVVHVARAAVHVSKPAARLSLATEDPSAIATHTVQSGDQTTPDNASAAENPEATSEGEDTTPETDGG